MVYNNYIYNSFKDLMMPDTQAYQAFVGENPFGESGEEAKEDSRKFTTWYSSIDMGRMMYALQMQKSAPSAPAWVPLIAAITPDIKSVKEVMDVLIDLLSTSEKMPFLPFVFTPDPGGSHYVAGLLIFLDDKPHLYIFDPLGDERREKRLREELNMDEPIPLHFFSEQVQKPDWEGVGIYSCGPICIQFIKSVLENPKWIESLEENPNLDLRIADLFSLPSESKEAYQEAILGYRQADAKLLNTLDDAQIEPAFNAQNCFRKGFANLEQSRRYGLGEAQEEIVIPVPTSGGNKIEPDVEKRPIVAQEEIVTSVHTSNGNKKETSQYESVMLDTIASLTKVSTNGNLGDTAEIKKKQITAWISQYNQSKETPLKQFYLRALIMKLAIPREGGWRKAAFGETDSIKELKKQFPNESSSIDGLIRQLHDDYSKLLKDDGVVKHMNEAIEATKNTGMTCRWFSTGSKPTAKTRELEEYRNNYIAAMMSENHECIASAKQEFEAKVGQLRSDGGAYKIT
jgi:hypothetical protein